ncbi:MAG: peptidoglycan-binding domain-containing protein [Caulobacteraceae bacterium]
MNRGKLVAILLVLVFSLTSVVFADTLTYGSKGQEVVKLQTQLKKLGYFKGSITNYFGSLTKAAVKKFQAKKGIKIDGIVGPQTQRALSGNGTSSKSSASKAAIASRGSDISRTVNVMMTAANADVEQKLDEANNNDKNEGTGEVDTNTKDSKQVKPAAEKKAKIEMLDWWSEASKVFYIGAVAKVTDVETGKSFYIKRTYGSNHADSETLTLEDTKIMKEIWGGEWNWSRRPVILEINGRRLAASMAGMPHAGLDAQPTNKVVSSRSGGYRRGINLDAVKKNGMSGHFDVHFLNSRTHGTNRVDPRHQKAVKEAAASGM